MPDPLDQAVQAAQRDSAQASTDEDGFGQAITQAVRRKLADDPAILDGMAAALLDTVQNPRSMHYGRALDLVWSRLEGKQADAVASSSAGPVRRIVLERRGAGGEVERLGVELEGVDPQDVVVPLSPIQAIEPDHKG